jgi:hypothetical protein
MLLLRPLVPENFNHARISVESKAVIRRNVARQLFTFPLKYYFSGLWTVASSKSPFPTRFISKQFFFSCATPLVWPIQKNEEADEDCLEELL